MNTKITYMAITPIRYYSELLLANAIGILFGTAIGKIIWGN